MAFRDIFRGLGVVLTGSHSGLHMTCYIFRYYTEQLDHYREGGRERAQYK